MNEDSRFLKMAVDLAIESVEEGGGPFGAVIVKNNKIIAAGKNGVTKNNDPTAHAEIEAIRLAGKILKSHDLSGCVLYTSCEPCPMCLGAIYWSHFERIVFALDANDAHNAGFDDDHIYRELKVTHGERRIPSVQMKISGAGKPFAMWHKYENRQEY